jgi:hypothetical protein
MFVFLHSKTSQPLVLTLFLECCSSRFEEIRRNHAFLPSEKEESRTFIIALISLRIHTLSQAISHSTTGESKSAREGRRTQDLLQNTCNLNLTQALSTNSLTRLDLARMPSQGGGSSLRSLTFQN